MNSEKKEAKYPLRVEFNQEEYDKLVIIKEHFGLRHDTEALRLAVNDSYKLVQKRIELLAKAEEEK